jgi:Uncharacterized paraquat-inducible protein A
MNRRSLGFAVLILAYVMLIPGLTQPMLQVKGAVKNSGIKKIASQYIADNKDIPGMFKGVAQDLIKRMGEEGEVEVYAKTQTILGTIKQLANAGYWLVAILIGLFSVVVPVTKGIMIVLANTSAQGERRALFRKTSSLISKWSMADVFVVAMMVTFLAANAITDEVLNFQSSFGPGFYFFTAYCLLSIASSQLLAANNNS